MFTSCTSWTIGDGRKISYWFDDWEMDILAEAEMRQVGGALSICQATALPGFMLDCNITFTNDQDKLRWNLTTDGVYYAKSVYAILVSGGKLTWQFEYAWHYHIPPSVIFLLLHEKILTRYVLLYRDFKCTLPCVMCSHQLIESAHHLLFQCTWAVQIWNKVSIFSNLPLLNCKDTLEDTWRASLESNRSHAKKWAVLFSCTCWNLWKQRNLKIFEVKIRTVDTVAVCIVQEATLWKKFC